MQTTAIWFWKCKKNLIVITPSRGILHIKYIYIWLLMISFREVPGDWLRQTNLFTIVKFGIWTIKKFQILDTVSCYLRTLNNSDNRFWKTNHLLMLFHIFFFFLLDLITKPQTQHSASCKTRIKQNLRNATSTRNREIMIVLYCCANTCCGLIHRYPSKLQHTGLRNNRNHCFKRKHVKS